MPSLRHMHDTPWCGNAFRCNVLFYLFISIFIFSISYISYFTIHYVLYLMNYYLIVVWCEYKYIYSYHSSGSLCCLSIATHSVRPITIAYFNAVQLWLSLRLASILSSLRSWDTMAGWLLRTAMCNAVTLKVRFWTFRSIPGWFINEITTLSYAIHPLLANVFTSCMMARSLSKSGAPSRSPWTSLSSFFAAPPPFSVCASLHSSSFLFISFKGASEVRWSSHKKILKPRIRLSCPY